MKKVFASIISLFFISLSSLGVYWFGSNEDLTPPEMRLFVGKQVMKPTLGSYHLKSWFTEEDVASPPDSEILEKIPPIIIEKSTKIAYDFSTTPKSVKFYNIVDDKANEYKLQHKGTFIPPATPGIYTYKIETTLDKNQATYYFKIEIK